MADIILTITLKDVNNKIDNVTDLVDEAFPGRTTEAKKEWIEINLKKYLKEKIKESKIVKDQNINKEIIKTELTTDFDPVFE